MRKIEDASVQSSNVLNIQPLSNYRTMTYYVLSNALKSIYKKRNCILQKQQIFVKEIENDVFHESLYLRELTCARGEYDIVVIYFVDS